MPGNTDPRASPAVAEVSRSGSEILLAALEATKPTTEMKAMKDTEAAQATEAVFRHKYKKQHRSGYSIKFFLALP